VENGSNVLEDAPESRISRGGEAENAEPGLLEPEAAIRTGPITAENGPNGLLPVS
jgi:hypothetical protein